MEVQMKKFLIFLSAVIALTLSEQINAISMQGRSFSTPQQPHSLGKSKTFSQSRTFNKPTTFRSPRKFSQTRRISKIPSSRTSISRSRTSAPPRSFKPSSGRRGLRSRRSTLGRNSYSPTQRRPSRYRPSTMRPIDRRSSSSRMRGSRRSSLPSGISAPPSTLEGVRLARPLGTRLKPPKLPRGNRQPAGSGDADIGDIIRREEPIRSGLPRGVKPPTAGIKPELKPEVAIISGRGPALPKPGEAKAPSGLPESVKPPFKPELKPELGELLPEGPIGLPEQLPDDAAPAPAGAVGEDAAPEEEAVPVPAEMGEDAAPEEAVAGAEEDGVLELADNGVDAAADDTDADASSSDDIYILCPSCGYNICPTCVDPVYYDPGYFGIYPWLGFSLMLGTGKGETVVYVDEENTPLYQVAIYRDLAGDTVTEQILTPEGEEERLYIYNHPLLGKQFNPELGNTIIERRIFDIHGNKQIDYFEDGFERENVGPAWATINTVDKNNKVIKTEEMRTKLI